MTLVPWGRLERRPGWPRVGEFSGMLSLRLNRSAVLGYGRNFAWLLVAVACVLSVASPARADKPSGVTAQTLKLPNGPSALKGLGESFSPNISTGTGSFSVPIQMAPGFLAPSVTLGYTGGKGKGVAGQSFGIPVLQVYRARDKGAPNFDEDDRFAVSGPGLNDELVLVNKTDRYYRLKNEGAYALFVRNISDNSWTVRFPSGQSATLGETGASQETSRGRTTRWFISVQQDRFNHSTRYDYFEDAGRVYLERIRYQLHAALAYQNAVEFTYESRPDVFTDYSYGDEVTTYQRLSEIAVTHGSRTLRTYYLTYKDAVLSSLLESVRMVGERGTPMPPLTFSYLESSQESGLFVPVSDVPPLESLLDGSGAFDDVNADGLPDLIVARAGNYHYYENIDGWSFGPKRLLDHSPDRTLNERSRISNAKRRWRYGEVVAQGFGSCVHRIC